MESVSKLLAGWQSVAVPQEIPHGDMPGDKVCIGPEHVAKAETVFAALKDMLAARLQSGRAVVSVCGGSGVGKSEIASVLGYYLNGLGIGTYIMSGDNYPRRIPRDNDAERLRVFRTGGLQGLVHSGSYTPEMGKALRALWAQDADADAAQVAQHPFLSVYQQEGRRQLSLYLGTPQEIDFDEVNGILAAFKGGAQHIALRRMGREPQALWYDDVDMTDVRVLILEWTHGNSDYLSGIDVPVLLNSTPAQTLAHRRARSRDGQTDSAFTTMVLELEQKKLDAQAHRAGIILSKDGRRLSYDEYRLEMARA